MKYCIFLLLILIGAQKKSFAQERIIDSLKIIITTQIPDSSRVYLLSTISNLYRDKNSDSTIYYAKWAQLIAEKSNDTMLMMKLSMKIMNTALYFRGSKKFTEAEELIFTCLSLREKAGKEYSLIGAYINLCVLYCYNRKYDQGINAGLTAMEISQKYMDSKDSTEKTTALDGLGSSYYWLGQIYFERGEYYLAIRHFTESVYYRNLGQNQRQKAQSLAGLARIYVKQNNYSKAITYFNESLSLYKEIGFLTGTAMVFRSLGNIYELQQNYRQALTNYKNSISLQVKNRMEFDLHITYQMLGILYLKISGLSENRMFEVVPYFRKNTPEQASNILLDSAGYYLSIACELSRQADDELILIKSLLGLAEISIHQNDFDKAFSQLTEAVSLAQNIDAKAELFEGYHYLSLISEKFGRYDEAYKYYKLYSAIRDSVFNENSAKIIAEIQIKFETEKKDKEIELLNKENQIKSLLIGQHEASMRVTTMVKQQDADKLRLLTSEKDLQNLQLSNTMEELEHQYLHGKVQANEMALMLKDKEISEEQMVRRKVQRDGIFILTVFLILVGFLLFRSQHFRKKLEKQAAIIRERRRISSDLHDDIGSGLSRIILLSEKVKKIASTPETRNEVEKIASISQKLSSNISEIIWALNSNNDYVENMVAYIRRYAAEYFENSVVNLKIITPDNISRIPISGEKRRNVFYAVKEVLHNIIKHAEATEAELKFIVDYAILTVIIKDNGKGLPHGELNRFGNGLNNLRNRMTSMNGNFIIENHAGTKVTLSLPM